MANETLHVDVETFCELDLKKVGTAAYTQHETFEILMVSFAFGSDPVRNYDLVSGDKLPKRFLDALTDPDVTKWAHNASFELQALEAHLGRALDPRQWRCTMVLAYSLSMVGALSKVGVIIGLPQDQQKLGMGTRLIAKFCKLRKVAGKDEYYRTTPEDDPEHWLMFRAYCDGDVNAERAIHSRLKKWDLPPHEWDLWALDQRINRTGLPVDVELLDAARELAVAVDKDIQWELKQITGLKNPNSRDQLLGWLRGEGVELKDMTKNTLRKLLDDEDSTPLDPVVRYVIEQRLEGNKASIKKYDALDRTKVQNKQGVWVVNNCFQFAGAARTWRWAGRIFQPQNIARGGLKPHQYDNAIEALKLRDQDLIETLYGSSNELLTSLVRPAVSAPEGHKLVVADLSSIESVVLAWCAESDYILNNIRSGIDSYKDYYVHLHKARTGKTIAIDDVTKEQRSYAKPPTLGCGYMLGAKGLVKYAEGMAVTMTEDEAKIAVNVFRETYYDIPVYWQKLESAAKRVIRLRNHTGIKVGVVTFRWEAPFMFIDLPSGRSLAYLRPKVEMCPAPWDENQLIENVTYEGQNQYTNAWERISTHAGKITENIVQAIARDVLANGMVEADNEGFTIVGHVHDEIISCVRDDESNHLTLDLLRDCMTRLPDWAKGMPLNAEGYTSKYFYKD